MTVKIVKGVFFVLFFVNFFFMLKVPPYSLEAEQSVLGCLLLDKDAFISIGDMLSSADFYTEQNATIFETIFELYKLNKPTDLITVKQKLHDTEVLDKVGGMSYLAEITDIVPTTANVYEYAQIVKNKAVLRNLLKCGNEIMACGYDEDKSIPELLERAEKAVFGVTQVFIQNKLVHINEILAQRYEEFAEIHENPESITQHRLQLGFDDLDNKSGGLKGGDMVIIAARPSMGKTAFALNLAQNVGNA